MLPAICRPPQRTPRRPPPALPAGPPAYVLPGSHRLDPPYAQMHDPWRPSHHQGRWPFPRAPWPFESESRPPGTGLLHGQGRMGVICCRCGCRHG